MELLITEVVAVLGSLLGYGIAGGGSAGVFFTAAIIAHAVVWLGLFFFSDDFDWDFFD